MFHNFLSGLSAKQMIKKPIKLPNKLWITFKPLSTKPAKWSNTLKQFVGYCRQIILSVFDHFVRLALKELNLKNSTGKHQ